jgi:hypothetical protein
MLKEVTPSGPTPHNSPLARAEFGDGLGDDRIFVRPVEAGARQQLHRAAVEPRMHAVAVVFDFVQPAVTVRRGVDLLLRGDLLGCRRDVLVALMCHGMEIVAGAAGCFFRHWVGAGG